MEETERTYDWKFRWGDRGFEYLKETPKSFSDWFADEFENGPQERPEPQTTKEKLEQAEVAEYEVVDDTPMVLGYAH